MLALLYTVRKTTQFIYNSWKECTIVNTYPSNTTKNLVLIQVKRDLNKHKAFLFTKMINKHKTTLVRSGTSFQCCRSIFSQQNEGKQCSNSNQIVEISLGSEIK